MIVARPGRPGSCGDGPLREPGRYLLPCAGTSDVAGGRVVHGMGADLDVVVERLSRCPGATGAALGRDDAVRRGLPRYVRGGGRRGRSGRRGSWQMREPVELKIDVTAEAAIGMDAHVAATVHLPDGPLADPPVVCFAFPGGGYCRRYFSFDMPGDSGGGEAGFHTSRGWIVVAVDHLGFGDSTVPEGNVLSYENIARGNLAAVEAVTERLAAGTLADGFPAVEGAVRLGIGQSMGGCFTIVLQGRHAPFDGIGVLGYSGFHTVVPSRPGGPPAVWPWIARGDDLDDPTPLNAPALAAAAGPEMSGAESIGEAAAAGEHPFAWAFHYDDVAPEIVTADLFAGLDPSVAVPAWKSLSTPTCGMYMVAPGTVALEAAAITVPVLSATGERDVVPDPWMEPKAFKSATDVTVYVCPRMAHMHNFAGTRHRFWQRVHSWGTGVAETARAT